MVKSMWSKHVTRVIHEGTFTDNKNNKMVKIIFNGIDGQGLITSYERVVDADYNNVMKHIRQASKRSPISSSYEIVRC